MPAYKDEKRNTWLSLFYYEDWQGNKKKKQKRGFKTKKEALEWENNFKLSANANMDMALGAFVEIYFRDKEGELKERSIKNKRYMIEALMKGYSGMVVYADDFVVCFEYKEEAEMFYEHLKRRMEHFGMELEEEKTRLIEFGRNAEEKSRERGTKPETFTFLGFTHYCSHGRNGKFRVKRKTSRKKFTKKCKEIRHLIREMRAHPIKAIIKKLNQILVGYYHYYGITDNFQSISKFRREVVKSLFKWLNRRSQRKSYSWEGFNEMLKVYPLAKPKIYVSVYAGQL